MAYTTRKLNDYVKSVLGVPGVHQCAAAMRDIANLSKNDADSETVLQGIQGIAVDKQLFEKLRDVGEVNGDIDDAVASLSTLNLFGCFCKQQSVKVETTIHSTHQQL